MKKQLPYCLAGAAAGCIAGTFGAGGGLILVPLLRRCRDLNEDARFPASVAIILPICITALVLEARHGSISVRQALPYLPGSALGGLAAGHWGKKIPAVWLHRCLGALIIWGGLRYLW